MNTSTIATRNESFFKLRNSGKLGVQQQRIMRAIRESNAAHGVHDHSLNEISKLTGLPINVVSGRVFELKDPEGKHRLLVEAPKRKCRVTNNSCTPVIVA